MISPHREAKAFQVKITRDGSDMSTKLLHSLVATLCFVGLAATDQAASAAQIRKKSHASSTPAAGSTAPSRASDLNSPATDFSSVAPVIEDPRAELLKPRKRKDETFD